MKFGLLLATSLALFGLGQTTSVQNNNLLQNGNFDQPTLTSGYRFLDSFPGWKGTGPIEQGIGSIYNRNWGNKVVVQLDAHQNYCISQNVKLSEGCYKFSLDYAARQGWVSSSQMTVSVNGKLMQNVTCPDTRIGTVNFDLDVDCAGSFQFKICGTGSSNSYGMTIGKAELSYVRALQTYPQPIPIQVPQYPTVPIQVPQYPTIPIQVPQYPTVPIQVPTVPIQYPTIPIQVPQYPTVPIQVPQPQPQPIPYYPQVPSFPIGRITLQSDTGKYLSRCNSCGPGAYSDSASVHESNPSKSHAIWTSVKVGDKIALRSDTGNYLGRCNNCWNSKSPYPDSAFVHVKNPEQASWSLWIPESLNNGKWALKNIDTGKYLARCRDCVSSCNTSDFAFVHVDNCNAAHAQWSVSTCV